MLTINLSNILLDRLYARHTLRQKYNCTVFLLEISVLPKKQLHNKSHTYPQCKPLCLCCCRAADKFCNVEHTILIVGIGILRIAY